MQFFKIYIFIVEDCKFFSQNAILLNLYFFGDHFF